MALLLLLGSAAGAEEQDAKALVTSVMDAIPKVSFVSNLELSSPDFETRKIEMSRKYVDGAHGTYLEVTAPEMLAGIRFLFIERPDTANEQYIKVAASRSSVRVSDEIRRRPYLGSAFYVSDLVMPELDRFCDAMISIRTEADRVGSGEWPRDDNPLFNAPHTAEDVVADEWKRPYSREQAAFPVKSLRTDKYWPPVGRIDGVGGDRNLVCACPPLEAYI